MNVMFLHDSEVEVRAIWYPIITIRDEDDIRRALAERRPYTVVYDTEMAP